MHNYYVTLNNSGMNTSSLKQWWSAPCIHIEFLEVLPAFIFFLALFGMKEPFWLGTCWVCVLQLGRPGGSHPSASSLCLWGSNRYRWREQELVLGEITDLQ